jgi:hypothetical protein
VKTPSKPKCTIDDETAGSMRYSTAPNSLYSATRYAGCSQSSSHISIESSCDFGVNYNGINEQQTLNDKDVKFKIKNEFVCHGAWQISTTRNSLHDVKRKLSEQIWGRQQLRTSDIAAKRGSIRRQYGQEARIQQLTGYNNNRPQTLKTDIVVLSTNNYDGHQHSETTGTLQKLTCLSYTEMDDGTLLAKVGRDACNDFVEQHDYINNDVIQLDNDERSRLSFFNITSSGPCLQALTGGVTKSALYSTSQNNCVFVMSYLITLTFASTSALSKIF